MHYRITIYNQNRDWQSSKLFFALFSTYCLQYTVNKARRPLFDFLEEKRKRKEESPYVFTSQRAERLTEAGIHHLFRALKKKATVDEWELIQDVTFHDLRHDFAHRARESGWTMEEIAYYLGHITKKGTPAIETTARYTQVGRKQIKEKLKLLKG